MRLFVFFLDPYVGIWVLLLAYAMQLGLCTDPWIQMGTDIADDAGCSGYTWSGSNFGSVVSSSGDGSRLAVSRASNYVRVYEWSDATNWTQSSELAIQTNDLGSSMQISRDGTHIAIGGGGKVAVYEYKSNAWTLKGSFLQSENNPHNGFGDAVSISDDGTRLAVGEPQHGNNPFNCTNEAAQGAARVYEWNTGQSSWDKMGSNFFCHNKTDDKVGHSNSISGDGNRVAVGAPRLMDLNSAIFMAATQRLQTGVKFVFMSGRTWRMHGRSWVTISTAVHTMDWGHPFQCHATDHVSW